MSAPAQPPTRILNRVAVRGRWVAIRLVAAAGALTAAFVLLGWALGARFVSAELALIDRVAGVRSGAVTGLATALTTVGSLLVLGPVAVLVALWCGYRGQRTALLTVLSVAVGAVAIANVVKVVVNRPRPVSVHLVEVASASFPSQHAAQAAAILPAAAVVLTTRGWVRAFAVALAGILVVGIGLSRVYLGVHYPSDVVAGWVLGLVWFGWVLRTSAGAGCGRG